MLQSISHFSHQENGQTKPIGKRKPWYINASLMFRKDWARTGLMTNAWTPCQREGEKENPVDVVSALNLSPKWRRIQSEIIEKTSSNIRPSISCFSLKIHIFFVFSASTRQKGKKRLLWSCLSKAKAAARHTGQPSNSGTSKPKLSLQELHSYLQLS